MQLIFESMMERLQDKIFDYEMLKENNQEISHLARNIMRIIMTPTVDSNSNKEVSDALSIIIGKRKYQKSG
jgi:hypothetical protein